MAAVPFDMGAGADDRFLYWLTRLLKPAVVVETGVAAGWTSNAFLSALKANGEGWLYSSDFPFFRAAEPEKYIGAVVDPALRRDWSLYTSGDEVNIPRILSAVRRIDLIHYDSDKTYGGKTFGIEALKAKLAPSGVILVDDISDDSWFKDYVERTGCAFKVFNRRYGMIGEIRASLSARRCRLNAKTRAH